MSDAHARIEPLDGDPRISLMLELQRRLSAARSESEMVHVFVDQMRELGGATHALDLDVRGLPPGSFRVRRRLVLDDTLTVAAIEADAQWDVNAQALPVHHDGLIAQALATDAPKLLRGLEPAADEVLASVLDGVARCDGVALPIYFAGRVAEWLLVFREPGAPVDLAELQLGIAAVNLLARAMVERKLARAVGELNGRLEGELARIGEVQRSLLPDKLPDVPGLSLAVHYAPARNAGGDYYDFRRFPDGSLGVFVADVAGHGPAAAVQMAVLRMAVGTYRLHEGALPRDIVPAVNRLLCESLREGVFATAFFLWVDPASGRASYANAGHPPARLRRADGRVEPLDADASMPLGIDDPLEPRGGDVEVGPGDTLVLYTDGLIEAFDARREPFGLERLDAAVVAGGRSGDAAGALRVLVDAIRAHEGGANPTDDQCAVVVRLT